MGAVGARKEMSMRSRECFSCFVFVLAVGLLVLPAAAQDADPFECTTNGGGDFKIATYGACSVSCDTSKWTEDDFCDTGTDCTGIEYLVDPIGGKTAAHAFAVVRDSGLTTDPDLGVNVFGDFNAVYPPCEGDGIIGGGQHMCHEQTISVNPFAYANSGFRLAVKGSFVTTWSSVYFMVGKKDIQSCSIPGLGTDSSLYSGSCVPSCGNFNADQTLTKTEKLNFQGCEVVFEFDLNTGEVVSAYLTEESIEAECDFDTGSVALLELKVDDVSYGFGKFGDGMISTGSNTCSCRVIGGRWWCWGRPCPD
jgi:hypothetical protein